MGVIKRLSGYQVLSVVHKRLASDDNESGGITNLTAVFCHQLFVNTQGLSVYYKTNGIINKDVGVQQPDVRFMENYSIL